MAIRYSQTRMGRPALELLKAAPRSEQRLLQQVLSVLSRADDPVDVQLQLTPVGVDQLAERVLVASVRTGEDLLGHARILAQAVPFIRTRLMTSGRLETRRSILAVSGFRLGGWFVQDGGKDLEEWNKIALDEALRAEAWLLGRRSYEFFGVRWRPRTGELADRLNSMPKYVVSSTLEDPEWNNSTVLRGDVVEEITKLKQELDREIVISASYQLGRTLIEHDLVDELRLVVFPVVLGAGERLFDETREKKPMRLLGAKTIGDGLAFLTYELVRER